MNMKTFGSLFVVITAFTSAVLVQSQQPYIVRRAVASTIDASQDVGYVCQFINLWTQARHTPDYPAGPHWSRPHVISHTDDFTLFKEGGVATAGVELVAEDGTNFVLEDELDRNSNVTDHDSGEVFFLSRRRRVGIPHVTFSQEASYMSVISMIAPSPDWFSGVNGFDMVDRSGTGNWFRRVILLLYPWDAGTDAGQTYTAGDNDEDDVIHQITVANPDSLPQSGAFVNGNRVRPVARLSCRLRV